jgi:uncharacterized protein with NAD-binding domain and iron-sulfur cluster
MAGVAAAWELSRPGWEERFESVTLYQRGWLLGGKGASTRAPDGRILEHGLHVWLGYYDNAFRLVRECYAELDRTRTDPGCPIRTWRDAFAPAPDVGVFEHAGGSVERWVARFGTNDLVPGDPYPDPDVAGVVRRGAQLAADLLRSARANPRVRIDTGVDLVTTVLRGASADGLMRPGGGGFASIDHLDFRAWLRAHGAAEATVEGGLVRGMYDLVFAYRDGDRSRAEFSAGLGVFLAVRMFLDYKGAIFWKMAAGMGDVVFAPLHQGLARRGVEVRYFHRVDALRLTADGSALSSVELTRQAPNDVVTGYDPLHRSADGLPCFPSRPRVEGLGDHPSTEHEPLPVAGEPLSLVVGEDVDDVVLAISLGALPHVAADLVSRHPRWRAMIDHVNTVPTRSAQLWLRDDEPTLGWRDPGATMSGLDAPFDTCASMTHLLPAEGWPADEPPRALAYLCSALPQDALPVAEATDGFLGEWSKALWPAGTGPTSLDDDGIVAHHTSANTDPSDRYVQSLPGSGQHRLRADGSGVDHLVLAGDWIDCGINAGCIEAATVAGLQAAAAVEGRPLTGRILGPLTWDEA